MLKVVKKRDVFANASTRLHKPELIKVYTTPKKERVDKAIKWYMINSNSIVMIERWKTMPSRTPAPDV